MAEVFESIVDAVSGSDWSYLIVFVIATLDAFFPIVPSEATAIAAGVVAGTGGLSVELVILAAALGAILGDNISFGLGHFLGHRVERLADVGVAGIHRLFASSERLRQADVIIVVAGMEGALPSVVGAGTENTGTSTPASAPKTRAKPARRCVARWSSAVTSAGRR